MAEDNTTINDTGMAGTNVRFTTAKVNDKDVDVVEIDRGPGNVVAFPVDEEAEKDENGKIVTYGEKYAAFRDAKTVKREAARERDEPSPQDHLYPKNVPKADKKK